ncbi:response regulator [Methylomonas sp. MgM2]
MMDMSTNGTVLIVDDTPGNLALLSDTLSEANYRVLVATDGQSALEQIQYVKPDIILLDVMMPGIDGFETCRRLKTNPDTQSIPVLFMTGLGELDDLLRGFGEGALDYIVKPIRPPEVLARVEVHLGQTRTLLRAERLLADSEFAALAADAAGRIVWLTPAGACWLHEFGLLQASESRYGVGDLLPTAILDWFRLWQDRRNCLADDKANEHDLAQGFGFVISPCEQPDQFILQLQRKDAEEADSHQYIREKLKLTNREAEILMWIARGKTNKEIGLILNTSPRTVNKHLEHVFEKLGVSTRSAAVAMAFKTVNP